MDERILRRRNLIYYFTFTLYCFRFFVRAHVAVTALWECASHAYDRLYRTCTIFKARCVHKNGTSVSTARCYNIDVFISLLFHLFVSFHLCLYRCATTFTPSLRTACQVIILVVIYIYPLWCWGFRRRVTCNHWPRRGRLRDRSILVPTCFSRLMLQYFLFISLFTFRDEALLNILKN